MSLCSTGRLGCTHTIQSTLAAFFQSLMFNVFDSHPQPKPADGASSQL
jgi:hypothetical protein